MNISTKGRMCFSKLADWDDDDPSTIADTSSKWDKVVILKHLFTLEELEVCQLSLFTNFQLIRSVGFFLGFDLFSNQ